MARSIKFRRFPMIWKFLIGCGSLAALLIVGSAIVVHSKTKRKSRGKYLAKHYKRFVKYQEGLGRAVSTVTDMIAADPRLSAALTKRPGPDGKPTTRPAEAANIASHAFKVLSGKNAIRPDLFVVFDSTGNMVWASPGSQIKANDLRQLQAVARVRTGTAFFNEVLVHAGRATQVAGVPIRSPSGDAYVGGVIIGVNLERYMHDYMLQSDSNAKMRHRLTLVHRGKIVATVWPVKAELPLLERQLDKDKWAKAEEGEGMVAVIDMKKDGLYDFHRGDVKGFAGTETGTVATMFLMRSRRNLKGRGPQVPYIEMVIGTALSGLIAVILFFWITRPIKRFVEQSQQMLEGETDLTQRVELGSRDETRELAENINEVFGKLYTLASEVQGASFHVGASSAEISAASRQMLDGLRDQTMKIEGSTAAVTELSASIQQVAENATEATKVAEKSNVAVTAAQQRMAQIRAAVEEAADKMQELGESSKRIGNIVEVIRQISEQTSLLALNASIEAAHAGEQGRGFAVVADEVSSLARRVGQSAKDIEALIQTIKEQTSEAMRSMEVGTREVESGTELVTSTLGDLQQLIMVVNDTAGAVQEQAEVSDEIARNMDAVQKIAGDVLSGSEESVIQAEQLHELAFALEESVRGFNLESGGTKKPAAPRKSRPALGSGD